MGPTSFLPKLYPLSIRPNRKHFLLILCLIYYQGTKTNGVIAILPNPLASSKNWAKK